MGHSERGEEIKTDLLRAAWLVESGRAATYERWAEHDARYEKSGSRSTARASIFAAALERRHTEPDHDLVSAHAGWIQGLAGRHADEVPLGNFFVARLGDWVEAHGALFLDEGIDEVRVLGDEERSTLEFPGAFPQAPPFEPLETTPAPPPGDVLFRFGILGDMHIGSQHGEGAVRAAIRELNASGAELVVQLGDVTDRGNKEEFDLAVEILRTLEVPVTTMMGNHDVFSYSEERLAGREYYGTAFGREPDGVMLEHKGFRFAILDSIEHGASPVGAFDLVTGTVAEGPGGAIVQGSLTPPQHEILADVAAPDSGPAFVFLHHPPQPYTGFPPILFGLRDADSGRLHATADSGNVWGVFAGHTHRNARTRTYGRVPVQEVAIPRDFPFGYALVDVTQEGYAFNFVQLSDESVLRAGYGRSSELLRRYGLGSPSERAFTWSANPDA